MTRLPLNVRKKEFTQGDPHSPHVKLEVAGVNHTSRLRCSKRTSLAALLRSLPACRGLV